ncbi:MAG: hypothetical protein HOW73_18910 [Polyangiaceae bacterium]|nr:hypothetical protein [Polyangiaceae bacterium]
MGSWTIDVTTEPGVLRLKLVGRFAVQEMTRFVDEHNRCIDGFGVRDYLVWADLTELATLSPECSKLVEDAKRYSHARPNFRGSAVLIATPTIALQQRRTSTEAGVSETELVSSDPAELREHLRRVCPSVYPPGASSRDLGTSARRPSKPEAR